MSYIPMEIDVIQIVEDLNKWGWRNFKIELACGMSDGYIAQIKSGNIAKISYQYGARLYNFWVDEQKKQVQKA